MTVLGGVVRIMVSVVLLVAGAVSGPYAAWLLAGAHIIGAHDVVAGTVLGLAGFAVGAAAATAAWFGLDDVL